MAEKTFFSYATVAPMGEPARDAVQTYLDEFYTFGPPDALYKYDPMAGEMSAEAAKLLNCNPEDVTFINNTTEGINIAAQTLPLEAGDEVLVQGNEYPANLLPWLNLRAKGVDVNVIKGRDNPAAFQQLLDSIGPKTKAISISAAQYYDGYMPDLAKLSQLRRDKGIFVVLDAVQAVGVRKVDLQETPVDFLVSGGQKYLQAGPGSGLLYVNPDITSKLRPTYVGMRSMTSYDEDSFALKEGAARFNLGTQNLVGTVALTAALRHINEIGIDTIEQKNRTLLGQIKACLHEHEIPFIDHGDQQSNIVSMKVSDAKALTEYLKDNDIYIRFVKDVARLSFIHTSTMEDVEILARATREWLDNPR